MLTYACPSSYGPYRLGRKAERENDSQEASDSRGRENSTIHNYEWYISEPNPLESNHLPQWLQRCASVCLFGSKPS